VKIYVEKDMRSFATLLHIVRDTGRGHEILKLDSLSQWVTPVPGECVVPTLRVEGFAELITWDKLSKHTEGALDATRYHLEDLRLLLKLRKKEK
jgi:hypothetical protein